MRIKPTTHGSACFLQKNGQKQGLARIAIEFIATFSIAIGCSHAWAQPSAARPSAAASATNAPASAQAGRAPLTSVFKAERVQRAPDGRETLEAVTSVSPGDVVQYSAIHRNVSGKRLLDVQFAIPVPWGMRLAQGVWVQSQRAIVPDGGRLQRDPSKGPDARQVVWLIERIEPGETVTLQLRLSIDPDPSLGAPPQPAPQPMFRR